eukprot:CAMPEP_0174833760 /NCGR_PEP_ID=MMETSP1114-20130205/4428_1 /TAXON_ID=312471 /ORGANISM="Neobodo designis, Strain CCAP 1951/1" /LENGTH=383 /DNA_ID=CAMNT_0016067653 /DNA_START=75 /DNA_END=1226 /DNA_ORIENTATION=+
MADVDDFIARHKQRLAQHRQELDAAEEDSGADAVAATEPEPAAAPHRHYGEPEARAHAHAANPHGNTWADAGRVSARRSDSGSAPREYVGQQRPMAAAAAASPTRSAASTRYMREYVVDSPTSVFDRSQRWASQRNKAVAKQRAEKNELETSECTFRPTRQGALTPSRAGRNGSNAAPISAARSRSGAGESPRVDAASYYQHIQRQEGARRDREDQQRKVAVDTTQWRNRTTTPREFQFGQRQGHIASLRKPCAGLTPRTVEAVMQEHRDGGREEPEADDINISDDENDAQPQQRAAAGRFQPRTARQSTPAGPSQADTGDASARAAAADADIVKLTKELMLMRAKSERQEEEIARLGGTVVSLKRELDAAKGKLRHYALGGD